MASLENSLHRQTSSGIYTRLTDLPAPTLVNLLPQTRAQLSTLDPNTPVKAVIKYGQIIVALSIAESLPSQIILPAGLHVSPVSNWTVSGVMNSPQTPLPDIISLRYRASIAIPSADSPGWTFPVTSLLAIDGNLLTDSSSLSDITSICHQKAPPTVTVFHASPNSPPKGLSITPCRPPSSKAAKIDIVIYASPDDNRSQVLTSLETAINRWVQSRRHFSTAVLTRHFRILGGGLTVSLLCATDEMETDVSAIAGREAVHKTLLLPMDRRLVRAACEAFSSVDPSTFDGGWPGRLADVHKGIKGHGMSGNVTVEVVDGSYLYCHYQQDKMRDSGWGCAYRSLQTLISWCVFEKYTSLRNGILPTHSEIQQALVDVGDQKMVFVGSEKWIGTNEVSYALAELTGVESKIMYVSRGSQMGGKARELCKHFAQHGSPVMVGGGVFAWTILGVARNEESGKVKFLILDPHYEGRDEIGVIQGKGWVGWKGEEIFKDTAFYNLCMPQRPKEV